MASAWPSRSSCKHLGNESTGTESLSLSLFLCPSFCLSLSLCLPNKEINESLDKQNLSQADGNSKCYPSDNGLLKSLSHWGLQSPLRGTGGVELNRLFQAKAPLPQTEDVGVPGAERPAQAQLLLLVEGAELLPWWHQVTSGPWPSLLTWE